MRNFSVIDGLTFSIRDRFSSFAVTNLFHSELKTGNEVKGDLIEPAKNLASSSK